MSSRAVVAMLSATWACVAGSAIHAEPLRLHANRVYLPVTLNGIRTEALLDSAAEATFVDPKLAVRAGIRPEHRETAKGSGGSAEVQMANHVRIEAAGVKLTDMTVALLDMSELSKLVQTDLQIILGREFFDAARVEIDIAGRTIRTLDKSTQPAGIKLPLTSERGIEHVPCTVEGIATACDIDIGNGSDVLIGRAFAQQHGLDKAGRILEKKQGGGVGGSVTRDMILLSTLEVAGTTFPDVSAAIDSQPTAGAVNVGTRELMKFVLVIDYPGRAIWFRQRE